MGLEDKVHLYLKASYVYYIDYGDPVITDSEYDKLCRDLYENWEELPEKFKERLSKDSLKAGTGFDIKMKDYKELLKWD